MYASAAAVASARAAIAAPDGRVARRPASRASAHRVRDQPGPRATISSSESSGQFSSTVKATLEEKVSSWKWALRSAAASSASTGSSGPRSSSAPARQVRPISRKCPSAASNASASRSRVRASSAGSAMKAEVTNFSWVTASPSSARQKARTCFTPRSARGRAPSPWSWTSASTSRADTGGASMAPPSARVPAAGKGAAASAADG